RSARRPPGPMASALLAFAAESGTVPVDGASAWLALTDIVARVTRRLGERPTDDRAKATDAVSAINAVVFDELGFVREIERDAPGVMALPDVLANRKGSCVGLGALYLAIAERLGVPLEGVLVPGHFFVRAPGATPRNAELLRRGEALPDAWYVAKYGPWEPAATAYLRGLSAAEVVAVHWFNAGNQWKRTGDLPAAARAYALATKSFPAFPEAAASLGATRQAQGDLAGARDAYQAAARARPDLPGLARNLSVLEAQQRRSPSPQQQPPGQQQPTGGRSPRR
ncbi:MAG: transglutaminase family protein, partial [Pseudomonadota bacterium]